MAVTKIQWADLVWNPITGCSLISEGCRRCYAKRMFKRLAGNSRMLKYYSREFEDVQFHEAALNELFAVTNKVVFMCSMSDLFHSKVKAEWLSQIFNTFPYHRDLLFLILTKRPERLAAWMKNYDEHQFENVLFGVSAENQYWFERRTHALIEMPGIRKWINLEPLIGPVNILKILGGQTLKAAGVEWISCGGESGPGSTACEIGWVQRIYDDCSANEIPFWFKQWGGKIKGNHFYGTVCEDGPVTEFRRKVREVYESTI